MRRFAIAFAVVALALPPPAACQHPRSGAAPTVEADLPRIDVERMVDDLRFLASDELAGRRAGTEGNARAREYILAAFREIGLEPVGDGYTQELTFIGRRDSAEYPGPNVAGMARRAEHPERYIVLTPPPDQRAIGLPDEA